jgi:uncharacterized protein YehS (DUF1456 family)
MADIFALGGCKASQSEIVAWLARDDDEGFKHCENDAFIRLESRSAFFRRNDDLTVPA